MAQDSHRQQQQLVCLAHHSVLDGDSVTLFLQEIVRELPRTLFERARLVACAAPLSHRPRPLARCCPAPCRWSTCSACPRARASRSAWPSSTPSSPCPSHPRRCDRQACVRLAGVAASICLPVPATTAAWRHDCCGHGWLTVTRASWRLPIRRHFSCRGMVTVLLTAWPSVCLPAGRAAAAPDQARGQPGQGPPTRRAPDALVRAACLRHTYPLA